jgi:hypothetical protein
VRGSAVSDGRCNVLLDEYSGDVSDIKDWHVTVLRFSRPLLSVPHNALGWKSDIRTHCVHSRRCWLKRQLVRPFFFIIRVRLHCLMGRMGRQ